MKKFTKSISSIIMLCLLLAGNSVYSKNNSFVDEPTAIFATTPVLGAITRTATSISFTVTGVAGNTYSYQRKENNGAYGAFTAVPGVPPGTLTITDNTITANNSYQYKVTATNAVPPLTAATETPISCGVATPVITSTVPNTSTAPFGIGLNFSGLNVGSTYDVYRRTTGGTFGAPIATSQTNFASYFDGFTPSPGVTYQYQIRATNNPNCEAFSLIKDAAINPLPKPVMIAANKISPFQLNVNWQSMANVERWYLMRSTNGGAYADVYDLAPTELLKEDGRNAPKLSPGVTYCYKVRAQFANGSTTSDNEVCGTTDPLPTITNLSANANNCSRITVTWTEPGAATINEENYRIYRSENGGGFGLLATLGNNVGSYVDNDLKPNTNYAYQVSSIYESIETPRSAPAAATTPPSVLTLVATGATGANLKWDLCTPFSQGWKIYLSTNGGDFVENGQVGPLVDSYTIPNLIPQNNYAAYVINFFGNGFGGPSNTVTFTTPKFPGPSNLNVQPGGTTSLKVTWQDNSNGPDNEEAFILYRSTNNGATYTAINLPPLLTTYTDNNLKASQRVCFYVVARFSNGFSDPSNTKCEVTCPTTLTEFTKIESTSSSAISLTWNRLEDADLAKITIESSLDGIAFTKLAEIAGTSTTYTDNTVLPNQKKFYRANVKNDGSCSSIYSLIASTTSCALAPTGVKATVLSSSSVEVNWDLGTNIKTYFIERSLDNIDFVKAGEVVGTISKFVDTKLASSKKYYYRVLAQNEGTCISAPSIVTQQATATTCANEPSALVAVANSAKEIKLTYTDNSPDETGFEVEWSKDGITFTKLGANLAPNTTSTTISTGIDAETKYFFRVRAVSELCNSAYSNIANVTTNPPAPTGLTAKGVKINQIDLAWTNTSKTANGIEIQRAAGADNNFTEINKAAVASVSYQNVGLTPATSYKYRLRYTSPSGNSDWSNVADATTLVISANENNELAKQITLYPVPSENTLFIKPSGSILGKISTKIVNASGATLITQEFNGFIDGKTEQINVSNLNTGIYFLEISTVKGSATKKFMKR